jgi:hypothetical protein
MLFSLTLETLVDVAVFVKNYVACGFFDEIGGNHFI